MTSTADEGEWVSDGHSPGNSWTISYKVDRVVVRRRSAFQELLVADLAGFGRALFLDGFGQSAEVDEAVYHEALVLPALVACRAPRRAFVAGGGEGAPLRELLRAPELERALLVDIDAEVVAIAREHLPGWHRGAFDDPRVTVVHADARATLAAEAEPFDVVILDLADPAEGSPAALLFTREFFELVRARLAPGGVVAMQADAADLADHRAFISITKTLRTVFRHAHPYTAHVGFYGATWGFVLAGDDPALADLPLRDVSAAAGRLGPTRLYDAEAHRHLFATPKFVRDALADPRAGKVIRDDDLLSVD